MFGKTMLPQDDSKRAVKKQFPDIEEQEALGKSMFVPERNGRPDLT